MRKKCILTIALLSSLLLFTGCTSEANSISMAMEKDAFDMEESGDLVNVNTSYYYLPVGTYDSADTAILQSIDEKAGTVTLYNTVAAKTYTLSYDGTTYVSDKYGTAMSMAQLTAGTIVNVNFFKATRQLVDIQISPEAWTYDRVTKYDFGGINSTATIGDRTYALTKGVQVFSQGEQADLLNIVNGDAITVSGLGYDIYSIKVESGHGYVRLTNDEALVGGWVEIGNELITRVTEEQMLLAVPEGEYTVKMYNDTSSVTQDIIVDRNQEVVLDCSGVTAPVDVYGHILFHITPDNATLAIDGEYKNTSSVITAEYGIHQIEVSASGYDTLSRYINVGTDLAEITVNLEESRAYVSDNYSSPFSETESENVNNKPSISNNAVSGNKISGNSKSGNGTSANKPATTTKGNRVYINSPTDVEVYVDGVYAGLSPMSFKKIAGAHTIILKRSGYETRSYTIYLYDDGDDVSISFSDLEKIIQYSDKNQENTSNKDSNSSSSKPEDNNENNESLPPEDDSNPTGSEGTDDNTSSDGANTEGEETPDPSVNNENQENTSTDNSNQQSNSDGTNGVNEAGDGEANN